MFCGENETIYRIQLLRQFGYLKLFQKFLDNAVKKYTGVLNFTDERDTHPDTMFTITKSDPRCRMYYDFLTINGFSYIAAKIVGTSSYRLIDNYTADFCIHYHVDGDCKYK